MKQTIYRYHSRISVFTGTEEECWQWVVNQAQTINSKREKFVRIFQEKDDDENCSNEVINSHINEMSTCPLCIERIENSSSGIETLLNLYPCERWMNYKKKCKVCSSFGLLSELKCEKCNNNKSLWCCLVCGYIGCNRYQEQHAMNHYKTTHHRYSIELNTQRIWDYLIRLLVVCVILPRK